MSILTALKLPLKLIAGLVSNKQKKEKSDLERKQLAYVRNFSPRHYGKNPEKKKEQKIKID
jgi:hypothetical protein